MKRSLQDGVINYEVRGSGKPLLVLHGGYLDHRHMIDALEPSFDSSSHWKRIYPDMPGHGLTTIAESIQNHDQVLDILLEFMAKECPNETFAVAGESRGGFLARGVSAIAPEKVDGLLLIVPGRYAVANQSDLPEQVTIECAAELLPELEENEISRFKKLVVQNRKILQKIRTCKIPAIQLANMALQNRLHENYQFSFDLDDNKFLFPKPTLVLLGRNDIEVGYKDSLEIMENYPRATYAILDKAGHSLSWEQPELFSTLLKDWLVRIDRYSQ